MKRVATVLAVVVATALVAATHDLRHAYACSGPPPWEAMAEMPVAVEGHVTTVERLPDPEVNRESFRYTVSVSRGHRGASAGERIVFVDDRLKPGIPSVCGQLQAELVNKRIVAGFENTNGTYRTGPRVAPFVGDAPEGPDYARAVRMAEVATGSNPSGPNLTSLEATVTCGQNAVMVGRRFKPRATYTLTHPGAFVENEAIRITADDGGTFKAPLKGYYGECPDREIWTYVWALEGEVDEFNCCDVPIAIARLRIKPGAAAPGPPDTGNGVAQEECMYAGDRARLANSVSIVEVEVVGDNTPPADPRTIVFPIVQIIIVHAGQPSPGSFMIRINSEPMLSECAFMLEKPRDMILGIESPVEGQPWPFESSTKVVLFAGNDRSGPEYDAAIAEVRASLPGVPAVGSGTALAASTRTVPWGDLVLVAILVMAFAGGTVAIVRSSRKR